MTGKAETIKDFLVGIGFDVDESGSAKADSAMNNLDSAVKRLGSGLAGTARNLKGMIDTAVTSVSKSTQSVNKNTTAVLQSTQAHEKGAESVQKLGAAHEKAGEQAKKNSDNVRKLDNQIRKATGTIKKYMTAALSVVIGSGIKSVITDVIQFNNGLVKSAKELKKSVEEARSYNLALKVMGKTIQDIEADESQKALFNDLQGIGKQLALPEAADRVGHLLVARLVQDLLRL